jgi:hypothetical protein
MHHNLKYAILSNSLESYCLSNLGKHLQMQFYALLKYYLSLIHAERQFY